MIIFHCEFSQRRGPALYNSLRDADRRINTDIYPKLFFPEIYVMEGGYSKFWNEFGNDLEVLDILDQLNNNKGGYVKM